MFWVVDDDNDSGVVGLGLVAITGSWLMSVCGNTGN